MDVSPGGGLRPASRPAAPRNRTSLFRRAARGASPTVPGDAQPPAVVFGPDSVYG